MNSKSITSWSPNICFICNCIDWINSIEMHINSNLLNSIPSLKIVLQGRFQFLRKIDFFDLFSKENHSTPNSSPLPTNVRRKIENSIIELLASKLGNVSKTFTQSPHIICKPSYTLVLIINLNNIYRFSY